MTKWINILHIYQPPTQTNSMIAKVALSCYRPLAKGILATPKAKLVLNINGTLTEKLMELGFEDVVADFRKAAQNGQIEFTGSGKYHPILPLLPKGEMINQIKLNEQTNKKYFGDVYVPTGFWSPELCYSRELAETLVELGYKWMVLDEISFNGHVGKVHWDCHYRVTKLPLEVIFRNRGVSDYFSIASTRQPWRLEKKILEQLFQITALDGETFGHHHKDYEEVLFQIYNRSNVQPILPSGFLNEPLPVEEIDPVDSSWSSRESELARGIPYELWKHPENKIQILQWELVSKILASKNKFEEEALSAALHSDQFWWASGRVGFGKFLMWSPEMVLKGLELLKKEADKQGLETEAICDKIRSELKLHGK